jgi:hypothetical protein
MDPDRVIAKSLFLAKTHWQRTLNSIRPDAQ